VFTIHMSHARCMTCPSRPPWYDLSNICWREELWSSRRNESGCWNKYFLLVTPVLTLSMLCSRYPAHKYLTFRSEIRRCLARAIKETLCP
jgi:hypothetical protein